VLAETEVKYSLNLFKVFEVMAVPSEEPGHSESGTVDVLYHLISVRINPL
jgi:hypothetical protein